jgi:hypothetical protein
MMEIGELARWIVFIKEYVVKQSKKEVSPVRGNARLPGLHKPRTRR